MEWGQLSFDRISRDPLRVIHFARLQIYMSYKFQTVCVWDLYKSVCPLMWGQGYTARPSWWKYIGWLEDKLLWLQPTKKRKKYFLSYPKSLLWRENDLKFYKSDRLHCELFLPWDKPSSKQLKGKANFILAYFGSQKQLILIRFGPVTCAAGGK